MILPKVVRDKAMFVVVVVVVAVVVVVTPRD